MYHRILIPAFALIIHSTFAQAQMAETASVGAAPAAAAPTAAASVAAAATVPTSLLAAIGAGMAVAGAISAGDDDPAAKPTPKGNLIPGDDRPYRPGVDPDSDSISDTSIGTFPGTF